jgi:hypothetical protein
MPDIYLGFFHTGIVLDVEYVDVDHCQVKQRGIVERPRLDGQAVGVTNFNFK